MARVLIPVMPRRYNANPKGSATVHVTMAGDNPFERPVNVMNSNRSMLPGMGALGLADAGGGAGGDATMSPSQPAATGVDWSKLLTGAVAAGAQLGVAKLQQAANPKLPKVTGITAIPVQGPYYPPAKSSMTPWLIGGGVLVVGIVGFFLLRRK